MAGGASGSKEVPLYLHARHNRAALPAAELRRVCLLCTKARQHRRGRSNVQCADQGPTGPRTFEGVEPMGRGRAKAKQVKVARQLKYSGGGTDLDRLRAELGVTTDRQGSDGYADLDSRYPDDDEDDDDESVDDEDLDDEDLDDQILDSYEDDSRVG